MPATAWDLFCSAWFSVISHWLTANSFFSRRFCSLSVWQCLSVLLCSASFIFFARHLSASASLWPALLPVLLYRGPNHAASDPGALPFRSDRANKPVDQFAGDRFRPLNRSRRDFWIQMRV